MERVLKNRYALLSEQPLGVGGSGNTYLAEDRGQGDRLCVVKQLVTPGHNPATDEIIRERFPREAATLKSLGNYNGQIPEWYDFFTEGEQFYLVQEWIDGRTLRQAVRDDRPFTEAEARRILEYLLPVLDFIHSQGIIHRDIKPDNIIIRAADRMPVLIDFGAVKVVLTQIVTPDAAAHGTTIVIGTDGYAPPEQLLGHPVPASDVYGLGQTVVYLLTGTPPKDLPPDPLTGKTLWRARAPHVSEQFAALLDRAIDPLLPCRYASADEMYHALKAAAQVDDEQDATVIAQGEAKAVGVAVLAPPPPLFKCSACDFWFGEQEEYCPACGSFNERHPISNATAGVLTALFLAAIGAGVYLALETSLLPAGIPGVVLGVAGGIIVDLICTVVVLALRTGFKQSGKPAFPLNDIEKRLIKDRLSQLGQQEMKLRKSLERLNAEAGAASNSGDVRQTLKAALEARHTISRRYKIMLWEVGFIRWANHLQAELAGWRSFAYHDCEQRLKSLDALVRRGESLERGITRDQNYFDRDDASFLRLLASLFDKSNKESKELVGLPDGKLLTARVRAVLKACRHLREGVVIQQAALAVKDDGYIVEATAFVPALRAALGECRRACAAFTVDDFYDAFFKLEGKVVALHG